MSNCGHRLGLPGQIVINQKLLDLINNLLPIQIGPALFPRWF